MKPLRGVWPRLRTTVAYGAYLAVATAVLLLLLEGGLRLGFGLPRGYFHYQPDDAAHLWRPNATFDVLLGPFPYTISTNRHGFRGPDFPRERTPGVVRVACLGDSVTLGFFVDNEQTYPAYLRRLLDAAGIESEVINSARGDMSIPEQLAVYERFVRPLTPDVVVLLFVSNDLDRLRGMPLDAVLAGQLERDTLQAQSEWLLFGHTAIGELLLDQAMRVSQPYYRTYRAGERAPWALPGGADFRANAQRYLEAHVARTHGIAGAERLTAAERETLASYWRALEQLAARVAGDGAAFVFVYYPDYSSVYLPERATPLRTHLAAGCRERRIPFVDLTPAFRAAGARVLHFAPVDFHPNAAGNRLIAESIGAWLLANTTLAAQASAPAPAP